MRTGRLWRSGVFRYGVLAGVAGGLAEIIWVCLYAGATGGDATVLARGITTAAGMNSSLASAPVVSGIFVHMGLAVLLGIALAGLWQSLVNFRPSIASLYVVSLAVLAGVWVANFYLVLPVVSPHFVHLVPYGVSLTSKLLFALAAAETLRRCAAPRLIAGRQTA